MCTIIYCIFSKIEGIGNHLIPLQPRGNQGQRALPKSTTPRAPMSKQPPRLPLHEFSCFVLCHVACPGPRENKLKFLFFETWSYCVAYTGLKFTTLLPQPPGCWDERQVMSCAALEISFRYTASSSGLQLHEASKISYTDKILFSLTSLCALPQHTHHKF